MHQPSLQRRDKSGYLAEDTIAAIASAVGGAICVLRVSGPRALECMAALADLKALEAAPLRCLTRIRLRSEGGQSVDDALFARFKAPESFTGEDVIELHLHGSAFIAGRVLELLLHAGARQALPGEFSFRAVRNGKMTFSQAQAVADLITASNDSAVQLALEKMSGSQNQLVAELAEGLRKVCVLGELGIDFSDQDVDEVSLPRLRERLAPLRLTLEKLRQSYERGNKIQDGIRTAFIGLPNAGKSSFFNALLGADRSIVSEWAGTTRDVVSERLTLRGQSSTLTLRMEDTAGLRETDHAVEKIGVERSQASAREADLILFLIDGNEDVSGALSEWRRMGAPIERTIGIITKVDLMTEASRIKLSGALASFGISSWIETSSRTGAGISEAIHKITDFCGKWTHRGKGEVLLTRLDQLVAVEEALEHLGRASTVQDLDLFAADLRQTLHSLSHLIGETPADDILGKIFSDFCIGK